MTNPLGNNLKRFTDTTENDRSMKKGKSFSFTIGREVSLIEPKPFTVGNVVSLNEPRRPLANLNVPRIVAQPSLQDKASAIYPS